MRVIDDYKDSECLINDVTRTSETITLPSAEFVARVAAVVNNTCATKGIPMFNTTVTFDDLKSAYRFIPVRDGQSTVIAYYCTNTKSVVFRELYGHAFGLVSAVLKFARVPTMYMTLLHKFVAVMATNYVDDIFTVDLRCAGTSAQDCISKVCKLTGSLLEPDKRKPPQTRRVN